MLLDLPGIQVKVDEIVNRNVRFEKEKFTIEIKVSFASMFESTDFGKYANRITENYEHFSYNQEYLYDLTVFEEKPSPRKGIDFITRTILVLESEWSEVLKQIVDDFQKLLVANAVNKVLVFRCHSTEIDDYLGFMMQNIREYQGGFGKYFLVAYLNDRHKFVVKDVEW